jgi:hypothetical protein
MVKSKGMRLLWYVECRGRKEIYTSLVEKYDGKRHLSRP